MGADFQDALKVGTDVWGLGLRTGSRCGRLNLGTARRFPERPRPRCSRPGPRGFQPAAGAFNRLPCARFKKKKFWGSRRPARGWDASDSALRAHLARQVGAGGRSHFRVLTWLRLAQRASPARRGKFAIHPSLLAEGHRAWAAASRLRARGLCWTCRGLAGAIVLAAKRKWDWGWGWGMWSAQSWDEVSPKESE